MPTTSGHLVPVPKVGSTTTWATAQQTFLKRHLAPGSRRVYALTLDRVGAVLGPDLPLDSLTGLQLADALHAAYPDAAPASWNRHLATLRSFLKFAERYDWLQDNPTQALERRRIPEDHSRALSRDDLDRLFTLRSANVRDRCLWRLLYETAARTNEVLSLNIEDLDLTGRRATTLSKGGNTDVIHWASGAARLLPKVVDGRTRGPLLLSERPPAPSRTPALTDLDPISGRARLSYRRAAEVFTAASEGATLHHLRHSAITHLAEDAIPTILLMAKSRHSSLRTLQKYAMPGVEAVARLTAEHDPARRRQ
jgi:site-specific recombinase XerD